MRRIFALALAAILLGCGARSSLPRPGGDGDGDRNEGGRSGEGGRENDGGGGEGGGVLIECDPDVLFVYVVTSETDLYKFDPEVSSFERVGSLACPSDASPFSMAVSRSGRAYSVYDNGELFRIDVHDASCEPTDWDPIGEEGDFHRFGMGYALDDDGLGESLYVADIKFDEPTAGLARLDTSSFDLDFSGEFSSPPGRVVELTSADDGELYGYFETQGEVGGTLVRIDKRTAEILERTPLPPPTSPSAQSLAFAYWNGDFYIFTGQNGSSDVTRYRPSTGEVGVVATLDREIVGAGVTTCDPDG